MSGEALYERYKDALRRGHVASLQGRLPEALTAYADAASIAPERATPHTSAGNALLRGDRAQDALEQYAIALRLAPRDESALLGRAEALATLDRPHEAADAFDALAEVRAVAGRLADAVDAARRGLELAEGRERRRILRALVERLRAGEPSEPGRLALERAVRALEGPAVGAPSGAEIAASETAPSDDAGQPGAAAAPVAGEGASASDVEAAPGLALPEPAPVRRVLDRDLADDADPWLLARAAEAAIDAGDEDGYVERLLDVAAAWRRADCREAALDACYQGLSFVPDNVMLHLALAELYDERGWRTLTTDKLALLDRMATLDDDAATLELVEGARATRA